MRDAAKLISLPSSTARPRLATLSIIRTLRVEGTKFLSVQTIPHQCASELV